MQQRQICWTLHDVYNLSDEEPFMEKQQTLRQQRRAAARSMTLVAIGGVTLTIAMSVTSILLTQKFAPEEIQTPVLAERAPDQF
ncbi:hypothetical protein AB833_19030 [Chromatiales bacterium (ex Bugula neritina AB1)]|nr:hypothetical protein AB833_19030 [Chromatiales bacterium (ex Bugula neritina AB1)]